MEMWHPAECDHLARQWGERAQEVLMKICAYLLQQVGLLYGLQHVLLGRLLGLSAQQELIQDEVGLLKVKDDIQLTHLLGHNRADDQDLFVSPSPHHQ